MIMVTILLCLALTTAAANREEDALGVAKECCAPQHVACCHTSFQFIKPLHCENMTIAERLNAINCAQKAFFGEEQHAKLSINDFQCCEVFENNENDLQDVCKRRCLDALQAPSLPVARKTSRIHHCRLGNQPLAQCFDRCVQWQHTNNTDGLSTFDFSAHCNWIDRLLPGKIYIGPAA